MENKILVFDMDGTIADLYNVEGWLADLQAYNPRPYIKAEPLYNMEELNNLLSVFKAFGWKIVVTTWLSKDSNSEYDQKVRQAKLDWLDRHNFPYDEIHMVKYGTTKANCTRRLGGFQILVDDNEKVRKGWNLGKTINANNNIIKELIGILELM